MEECGRNKLRPSRFGCVRVACLMSARRFPPRQRRISAQAADAALQISIGHLAKVLRLTSDVLSTTGGDPRAAATRKMCVVLGGVGE